jgi:hypothetical protein
MTRSHAGLAHQTLDAVDADSATAALEFSMRSTRAEGALDLGVGRIDQRHHLRVVEPRRIRRSAFAPGPVPADADAQHAAHVG